MLMTEASNTHMSTCPKPLPKDTDTHCFRKRQSMGNISIGNFPQNAFLFNYNSIAYMQLSHVST